MPLQLLPGIAAEDLVQVVMLHDLAAQQVLPDARQHLNHGIADDDVLLLYFVQVVHKVVYLLLR